MGRKQNKNPLNNRKTYMTPPESRDSTPARSEKPNTEVEEEMDLKNGTKNVSITNRIQEMEERISVVEGSLEDI
ncbi:hypothetical protein ACQP3F_26320 [Escherichia coli]